MKKLNKKGFTLVELLAVIVILSILMVVAFSVVPNVQENARTTAMSTEAKKLENQVLQDYQLWMADPGLITNYNFSSQPIKQIATNASESITLIDSNYKVIVKFDGAKFTEYCIEDTVAKAAMLSADDKYVRAKTCKDSKSFN